MNNAQLYQVKGDAIKLRRSFGRNFEYFRKYYFPLYHSIADAPFHRDIGELLVGASRKRGVRIALASPRNSAKSTIASFEFVIYCICYHLEDFIVIISNTKEQAESFLTNIKFELETNPRLKDDFPDICEIGEKPKPPRWRQDDIITKNGIEVLALGYNQQIRSRKYKQSRPSLIILDDLEAGNAIQSTENFERLYDYLTRSVLKSGTSATNVVFLGTIHNYGSLLAQFTSSDAHPGWEKRIYRSIISWSVHPELWEKWERIYSHQDAFEGGEGPEAALRFFEQNKTQMLEGAQVLWEAKYSYYDLMVMRLEEGTASFDSEMQNEPVNPRDRIFDADSYGGLEDKHFSTENLLVNLGAKKRMYGGCDPSLGKESRRSDYTAIVTVAKDTEKGTLYVIDADVAKRKPDNIIETIMSYQKIRGYTKFGVETNQFQEFLASELKRRSELAQVYVPVVGIPNTTDKLGRFQSLQPLFASGVLQLSRRLHVLIEQMKHCPKGAHDDAIDALWLAVKLALEDNNFMFWVGGDGSKLPCNPDMYPDATGRVPYGWYGWHRRG
ncbi:MAG: phage terminase large subunit [Candidatus Omnitrophota bacterium]